MFSLLMFIYVDNFLDSDYIVRYSRLSFLTIVNCKFD